MHRNFPMHSIDIHQEYASENQAADCEYIVHCFVDHESFHFPFALSDGVRLMRRMRETHEERAEEREQQHAARENDKQTKHEATIQGIGIRGTESAQGEEIGASEREK